MISQGVTSIGFVEAQVEGDINAPSNSVTKMITSTSLITTNPTAYSSGREKESDESYRLRIKTTNSSSGKATVEAIQDDVSLVAGVVTVRVIDNDFNIPDIDGRPPHSFETIVEGGTLADLGKAIITAKPAGIESYGNTPIFTEDKYGNPRTVYITRPVSINLAFLVEYTKDPETPFPVGGQDVIKEAVRDYTATLSVGQDVIPVSYYCPIIAAVGTLAGLTVSVQQIVNQGDAPNPANWQTTPLAISSTEFASTTLVDVTTAEV